MKAPLFLVLALALSTLGGCANNKLTAERNSLVSQNQQQAAQIEQLNTELQQANSARSSAENRATALTGQLTTATPPAGGGVMDLGGAPIGGGRSGAARGGTGTAGRGGAGAGTGSTPVARGSTPPAPVVLEIGGDVLFDSGKTSIKATADKTLDDLASKIKGTYSGRSVRIVGHTDATPMKATAAIKDNTALGLARATSVKNYLVKKGIPSKDLHVVSKGASEPKSKTNISLNRRVEIIVE